MSYYESKSSNPRRRSRPLAVHVIDRLPPGGAERLLVDVLKNRTGAFDYTVLCLVKGGALVEELREMGVPVVIFGKKGKFDLKLLWRLCCWFRVEGPAVVHTHLFTADSWGRLAALIAGVPGVFCTAHSENNWKGFMHRTVDRALAPFSNKVIACTNKVAESLRRRDRIAEKRIETAPNGIDLDRIKNAVTIDFGKEFGISNVPPKLAIVGRLHPAKGHLDLLPVMAQIKGEGLDFHLLIVGEGELKREIENRIISMGLEGCVIMTGFRRDVLNILASIDVLLMPSRWEGLPITLLEAMALGKATIGSAVGGIPDVIEDGRNGFLFEPGNIAKLADGIRRLLQDNKLRGHLGKNAKTTVEAKHSAAGVCRKYESLYRRALSL